MAEEDKQGDTILHYGVKRRSGRYPWGSGEDPQRSHDILDDIEPLKKKGFTQKEQAEALGMTTTQLRSAISLAGERRKQSIAKGIRSLQEEGVTSNTELGRRLGVNESYIRRTKKNMDQIQNSQLKGTADALKDALAEHPYLDIGAGTEIQMGVSRTKLNNAIAKLKQDGYSVHEIYVPQVSDTSKFTIVKVLSKDKDINSVKRHKAEIVSPGYQSDDGGLSYKKMPKPKVVDANRVSIRYGDKGGEDRDGLIQVRPGTKDLDLGTSHYAQVRIKLSDGTYMKGMAMYDDHLPDGKDLIFNTNKKSGTPRDVVFKKLKSKTGDPSTQFGATVVKQKGALNIVNDEGSWNDWHGDKFSAQFLSKQPLGLIKDRINTTYKSQAKQLDDILKVTNPVVKKKLLADYAEGLQAQEKELHVMGLPHSKAHVLLPFPDMKPNEIYAPNYHNGDRVVLIRYPHAGTFEIPELTVNNKIKSAKKALGNSLDAVGIHPSMAHKLSGADFDGDVAYVIPNNKRQIKSTSSLSGLKDYDTNVYHVDWPTYPASKSAANKLKQTQMGEVSNLITDMTIKGATTSELTRAVRHSMVVIDSQKHNLDWKQSEIDNGISALRNKYQKRQKLSYKTDDPDGKILKTKYHGKATDDYYREVGRIVKEGRDYIGGSTLISRAKSSTVVVGYKKDKDGNDKLQKSFDKKKGTYVYKKIPIEKPVLDMVDDASILSSGTPQEKEYVSYINNLKKLVNKANHIQNATSNPPRNKVASKLYSNEVKSLDTKLTLAEANAPRERRAQILANEQVRAQRTPETTSDQLKKLKSRALADARARTGAQRTTIQFTPTEWEAVQAGAISSSKLSQMLKHADMDTVQKLATPHATPAMPTAKIARAKALLDGGYSTAEVATALGVSATTLRNYVKQDTIRKGVQA